MSRRVFITVGEVSGDRNAANLARELKQLEADIVVDALGGPALREAGAIVHHDTVTHAAMGFRALLRAMEVRRLLAWTRDYYQRTPPDLHVCVDSWSMNWLFARQAKKCGIPVLYYIAPQAWASRPGRVKRLRKYVDRLACILPFEEQWFSNRGVRTTFVGHPLFDHLAQVTSSPQSSVLSPQSSPVIGLLPGSRSGIARNNFRSLLSVAEIIGKEFPAAKFLVPTTANTDAVVREELSRRPVDGVSVGLEKFDEMVPQCNLCLTVSGTATLHVAAHDVPMIVVYRGSWLLWNLVGRWIINARTFALVNILSPDGRPIVPEFIPWHGQPQPVARCALDYLRDPGQLVEQRHRLAEMITTLAGSGASRKVAELAMQLVGNDGKRGNR
jgi:lipid-A-disaccharide synthase